jgi:hypothetical protein
MIREHATFCLSDKKSAKKSKSKDGTADFTAACLAILQLELGRMAGRSTWHIGRNHGAKRTYVSRNVTSFIV